MNLVMARGATPEFCSRDRDKGRAFSLSKDLADARITQRV